LYSFLSEVESTPRLEGLDELKNPMTSSGSNPRPYICLNCFNIRGVRKATAMERQIKGLGKEYGKKEGKEIKVHKYM
jgi:hypothetical protein